MKIQSYLGIVSISHTVLASLEYPGRLGIFCSDIEGGATERGVKNSSTLPFSAIAAEIEGVDLDGWEICNGIFNNTEEWEWVEA